METTRSLARRVAALEAKRESGGACRVCTTDGPVVFRMAHVDGPAEPCPACRREPLTFTILIDSGREDDAA